MRKRALAALLLTVGCAPYVRRARLTVQEPPSDVEVDAAWRLRSRTCDGFVTYLFPGVGQLCTGRPVEGALLMTLGAAELTTAIVVATSDERGTEHPGAAIPLIALQDAYLYSLIETTLDVQRAQRLPFVPQDSLGDLIVAPFNWRVMGKPDVLLGLLGTLAFGIGASLLVDESTDTSNSGKDPNLFGHTVDGSWGHPLAGAIGVGLFSHVAIAEETFFRGYVQSGLARAGGETQGWLLGSLIFGASHALNALTLPKDQVAKYLLIGVPSITIVGSYLGLTYRWNDYSLAPSVAVHFWYDFLLSAFFYALDPTNSPISASVTLPF